MSENFRTAITLELDGDVVRIDVEGPDLITNRFNISRSTYEAGVHERRIIATRSSKRRAMRFFSRIIDAMYDEGWIPIDGGGIFSQAPSR
jgi:hypothetical protein